MVVDGNKSISVVLIEEDFYARSMLENYIERDIRSRIVWSGSIVEFCNKDKVQEDHIDADIVVLGQQGRERITDVVKVVAQRFYDTPLFCLVNELSEVDAHTVGHCAKACAKRSEINHSLVNGLIDALTEDDFLISDTLTQELQTNPSAFCPDGVKVADYGTRLDSLQSEKFHKTMVLYCVWGFSRNQIASTLDVAANTVSSRLKSTYTLLGVNCREEAFQRLIEKDTSRLS